MTIAYKNDEDAFLPYVEKYSDPQLENIAFAINVPIY